MAMLNVHQPLPHRINYRIKLCLLVAHFGNAFLDTLFEFDIESLEFFFDAFALGDVQSKGYRTAFSIQFDLFRGKQGRPDLAGFSTEKEFELAYTSLFMPNLLISLPRLPLCPYL